MKGAFPPLPQLFLGPLAPSFPALQVREERAAPWLGRDQKQRDSSTGKMIPEWCSRAGGLETTSLPSTEEERDLTSYHTHSNREDQGPRCHLWISPFSHRNCGQRGSFVNAHFVGVSAGSAEKEAGTGAAKCVRGDLADQSQVTEAGDVSTGVH